MNLRRLTLLAILAGLSSFSQLSAAQPEPWQYWLQHDPSSSVQVSHSIWQKVVVSLRNDQRRWHQSC
jgi:hypothetical protein